MLYRLYRELYPVAWAMVVFRSSMAMVMITTLSTLPPARTGSTLVTSS